MTRNKLQLVCVYILMEEIWKLVDEFPGYEVSNLGRVKRTETNRIIRFYDKGGYVKVQMFNNGTQKKPSVHRLVAVAFIPNPGNKPDIHHIDHDKTNNRVDNLMWVTPAENNSYNLCNPFRIVNHAPKKIASIDYYEFRGALFRSLKQASKALNIPAKVIKTLCTESKSKDYRYLPPKYY